LGVANRTHTIIIEIRKIEKTLAKKKILATFYYSYDPAGVYWFVATEKISDTKGQGSCLYPECLDFIGNSSKIQLRPIKNIPIK